MHVDQTMAGRVAVFRVSGAHRPHDVGRLRALVSRVLRDGTRAIVLDLGAVSMMCQDGLGELVGLCGAVRRHGGELRLSTLPPGIRALLVVNGLEPFFQVARSEREAVQQLTEGVGHHAA